MKGLIDEYFNPLAMTELPARLLASVTRYGAFGRTELNFTRHSFLWRVRAGFTLKEHAPKAGPCFRNFKYLQDWGFDDQPTEDAIVCWIPRLAPGTLGKNRYGQNRRLADLRQRYGLPAHYLSSRGSAALIAGLILAHFKARSGLRTPPDCCWVETDTFLAHNKSLFLGGFDRHGLQCANHHWGGNRRENTGCFPLALDRVLPGDFAE